MDLKELRNNNEESSFTLKRSVDSSALRVVKPPMVSKQCIRFIDEFGSTIKDCIKKTKKHLFQRFVRNKLTTAEDLPERGLTGSSHDRPRELITKATSECVDSSVQTPHTQHLSRWIRCVSALLNTNGN